MPEFATQPKVAIIILNWNNPEDTLACLRSVAALAYPTVFTLVVDNGSTDDSIPRIRANFPDIQILETGANLGYAGGNNAGIRRALAADAECGLHPQQRRHRRAGLPGAAAGRAAQTACRWHRYALVAEQVDGGRVWALGSAVGLAHSGSQPAARRRAGGFLA